MCLQSTFSTHLRRIESYTVVYPLTRLCKLLPHKLLTWLPLRPHCSACIWLAIRLSGCLHPKRLLLLLTSKSRTKLTLWWPIKLSRHPHSFGWLNGRSYRRYRRYSIVFIGQSFHVFSCLSVDQKVGYSHRMIHHPGLFPRPEQRLLPHPA